MAFTSQFAAIATDFQLTKAPRDVILWGEKAFLDCIGVMLAGSDSPAASALQKVIGTTTTGPGAHIFGSGVKTSELFAALCNGTMAHALDFDDGASLPMPMHPSAATLPAILALGEIIHASGREVLAAYILALETQMRLAAAMDIKHYEMGWHATGTIGTIGATIGCAKLLNLSKTKLEVALGIAASLAGGCRANFGTMTKPLHAGQAARNGILASRLAQEDFSSCENIFDTQYGFLSVFLPSGKFDDNNSLTDFGEKYYILEKNLSIKKHAACYATHTAIDGVLDIMKRHKFYVDDIESITCEISELFRSVLRFDRPSNELEAKFSLPFAIATALNYGHVGHKQFTSGEIEKIEIKQIMSKVDIKTFPADQDSLMKAHISITLRNSCTYALSLDLPKGFGTTLSWEEVQEKFRMCSSEILPESNITQIIDTVMNLCDLREINDLVSLCF